ncbi:TPA: hypothetical protein R3975_001043 [Salmonella enterica subsp. enterica serovar Muenchen]|nr:hypothetical protein [Salmonella enterica subsp. enterica]HEC7511681.1 hypothetical protein [Salmonella enterica subsp. enterica serovar Muenchen]HEC7516239.1 hypothetical protein [Salmonella enterica subsp. enterica serovar Muenchen]HEC7580271.1 hypothetical protein [Salmonella enterica subsp. enterica serovar Muenchen]HEC8714008.1 hypothetical protein [Salmonella enterica subsp. enterica serovar Muenchen]
MKKISKRRSKKAAAQKVRARQQFTAMAESEKLIKDSMGVYAEFLGRYS